MSKSVVILIIMSIAGLALFAGFITPYMLNASNIDIPGYAGQTQSQTQETVTPPRHNPLSPAGNTQEAPRIYAEFIEDEYKTWRIDFDFHFMNDMIQTEGQIFLALGNNMFRIPNGERGLEISLLNSSGLLIIIL
jgi:hypothetical protein